MPVAKDICGGDCKNYSEPEKCNNKKEGWFCTKLKGHSGRHIACGLFIHNLESWEQGEGEEKGGKIRETKKLDTFIYGKCGRWVQQVIKRIKKGGEK